MKLTWKNKDKNTLFYFSSITHWHFRKKILPITYIIRWGKNWWIKSESSNEVCGQAFTLAGFSALSEGYWVPVTSPSRTLGNRMLPLQFPATTFPVFWVGTLENKIIYEVGWMFGSESIIPSNYQTELVPQQADAVTLPLKWQGWRGRSFYFVTQIKRYIYMQRSHLAELKISSLLLWKMCLTHLHVIRIVIFYGSSRF